MRKDLLIQWLRNTPSEEVKFFGPRDERLEVDEAFDAKLAPNTYIITFKLAPAPPEAT